MELGVVGLGRMGAAIAERLKRDGHSVIGFDQDSSVSEVGSLADLVSHLTKPRIVWLMVPAGAPTQATVEQIGELLSDGDIVIDGGNSYYKDSIRHAAELAKKGIAFLDIGTSGGIWGLEGGFCLMAGGDEQTFAQVKPILASLAPDKGCAYVGSSGAGHYAKMVHNGIEYGMLQAYAEGFQLLQASDYDYELSKLATLWNSASVIRSWLLELGEDALTKDPHLERLRGYVDDSGEGRWAVIEAVERAIAAPVITEALYARFVSRDENSFADRFIAALRNEFGGHPVHKA